jgi:ribosome biogenesis GTPase
VVVRVDRTATLLDAPEVGPLRAGWSLALRAAVREDPEAAPCTGDHVTWRAWPDGRVSVEDVLPRRSLLSRTDASRASTRQVLAANMDVVAIVEGLVPDPDLNRIARLLALAWSSGARPVVLLTKADLVPDGPAFAEQLALSNACDVHLVSVVTGDGVREVREMLAGGRVMALLGASGVGKSTLVNALADGELMRTRGLRQDGKGRHTTVTRELHPVAGGFVIDAPGLRSVGLAGAEGLDATFADVLQWAADCRFSDCGHGHEPGCGVLDAVDRGDLDGARLDSWRRLVAEGRSEQLRRDLRLRAEDRRRIRVVERSRRRAGLGRP